MIASDRELKKLIERGAVYVEDGFPPIDFETQLGPSSLDLRLGTHFITFKQTRADVLDTKEFNLDGFTEDLHIDEDEGILVHPDQFVLATTMETVHVPTDMAARIEGRSSYGRLGIAVHSTAGFCDPGWEGNVTLEIQNLGNVPVRLYPGERICQLVFHKMTSEARTPYSDKHDAKYMGQKKTITSRLDQEKR